jgi:3-mercaptopyruvate sulfurtransferase SseA
MSTILTALAVLAATTPGLLLSPADLASALNDPATIVIAVGSSEDDFIAGHIPGARFVNYNDTRSMPAASPRNCRRSINCARC